MPSIAYVQRSCLMTLNNLLSVPAKWNPIVPDRRHSMPSSPTTSTTRPETETESSSALRTLVSNLRNRAAGDVMTESHQGDTDADLINELRIRVEDISSSLKPDDAQLANRLVSLLSHFNRLSIIQNATPTAPNRLTSSHSWTSESSSPADLYNTLKRQLSNFQIERLSSQQEAPQVNTPILAVETALLWTRIDEELDAIVTVCKERTEHATGEFLPPQYDSAGYHFDTPPAYDHSSRTSVDESKSHPLHSPTLSTTNEKMRLDLEAVTMAIDRLYLVAPQLHNQRVELKSTKVKQMEKARAQGSSSKGKQKEKDIGELDDILRLISKASSRSLTDQTVVLEGGMKSHLEKARLRDIAKVTSNFLSNTCLKSYIYSSLARCVC